LTAAACALEAGSPATHRCSVLIVHSARCSRSGVAATMRRHWPKCAPRLPTCRGFMPGSPTCPPKRGSGCGSSQRMEWHCATQWKGPGGNAISRCWDGLVTSDENDRRRAPENVLRANSPSPRPRYFRAAMHAEFLHCHASLARRMKAAGDAPFVSKCAMILVQAVSSCKFAEAQTNQRRFRLRRSKIFHVRSGVTLPLGCLTDPGF
jgi:hypothetical protein